MPSIVSYNGIVMHSVLTTRFEQSPVYDASGTDVIASRFAMTFEGICHAQGSTQSAPVWVAPQQSGTAPLPTVQQAFNAISQALWQPRKKLTVNMGGAMLFVCNPSDSGTQYDDVENGPKPRGVRLSHITANNTVGPTFHVTFEIDCVRTACPKGIIQDVLSNRWSITETFDEQYYTTRTIAGQIRLSSSKLPADAYRALVVPTLEKGFRRESLHWNIHPDGLSIDYQVTDRQVEHAPPWPAAKMNVRHSEGTSNGANFEGECHVNLAGAPGADKAALFALAVRIIENRLGKIGDMPTNYASVPVAFTMVDTIGDRNELEVYLKVQHTIKTGDTGSKRFLGTPIGRMGKPLDDPSIPDKIAPIGQDYPKTYDAQITPVPNPWGYNLDNSERTSAISRLTLQCFCQNPCDHEHWVYQSKTDSDHRKEQAKKSPSRSDTKVYNNPTLQPYESGKAKSQISEAGTKTVFTFAAGETTVSINPLRAQLPIAADPGTWDGMDDTAVFVTLGLPQAMLTFSVEAERVGEWPAVPKPEATWTDKTTGLKGTLLSSVLKPMPPTTDACATKPIYHVSATIVYGLNRPPKPTEKIPVGCLQWTSYQPKDTAVLLADLYDHSVQPIDNSDSSGSDPTKPRWY